MPRKGENIYKRKDGRWEGRYTIGRTIEGKIIYKSIYGHSYLEVKEKLIIQKSMYQKDNVIISNKMIITTISKEWLTFIREHVKESSFIKYNNIIENYIIVNLGNLKIKDLNIEYINLFILNLKKGGGKKKKQLSIKTVADIFSVLKQILKYAERVYQINICDLSGLKIKLKKQPIKILTQDECKILIKYLVKYANKINIGILLALFTGIRIGELCALKYKNILFDEAIMIISETLQRIQKKDHKSLKKTKIIITTPKTMSSIRKIPIPLSILPLIVKVYSNGSGFLLTGDENKFIEPRTIQNRFRKILNETKISQINFHILRHTFATQCLINGMDIKSLSEILGHANVNITLDKYVHPSFEEKRRNMNKLGEYLTVK